MTTIDITETDETPDILAFALTATSKKHALELIAQHLADNAGLCEKAILNALIERERLGSTAIGGGLALPHALVDSAETTTMLLATFDKPIEFDAEDGQAVDVFAAVLGTCSDQAGYKSVVSSAAEILRGKGDALRASKDLAALKAVLEMPLRKAA